MNEDGAYHRHRYIINIALEKYHKYLDLGPTPIPLTNINLCVRCGTRLYELLYDCGYLDRPEERVDREE